MRYFIFITSFLMLLLFLPLVYGQSIDVTSSYSPDYHFKIITNADTINYFPIGWYNTVQPQDLDIAQSSKANIVFNYWNAVYDNYHYGDCGYNIDGYLNALIPYLDSVNLRDMKAIIDLGVRKIEQEGFTITQIARIVDSVADHPAVFGWYLADEPYGQLRQNCGLFPTRNYLKEVADTIKSIENRKIGNKRHIIIPIVNEYGAFFTNYNENPNSDTNKTWTTTSCGTYMIPPAFDSTSYNSIGWDYYVYNNETANNSYPWRDDDYNTISRVVTKRGIKEVIKNNDMGFIFVGMAHDKFVSEDFTWHMKRMYMHDIVYESISPIIQGARGLLYYWWNKNQAYQTTLDSVNIFINFFRKSKLDTIIMAGIRMDSNIMLNNFKINSVTHPDSFYIWGNYNNGTNDTTLKEPKFRLFNYIVRKWNGAYYLFVVNDFKPTIQTDFVLDGILNSNESVYQIVELNVDGTKTQKNFNIGSTLKSCTFNDVFNSYDTKIYKIDVFTWSPTDSLSGVADVTKGGGVCIADFNNDGKKDFVVMGIKDSTGSADPFRFKFGWSITKSVDSKVRFTDRSSHDFPSVGYGVMSGAEWETSGGGLATYDLDHDGRNELFFMGIDDDPNAADPFRLKIAWDVFGYTGNSQPNDTVYFTDRSCHDFPPLCRGEMSGPSWVTTGGDIAINDIDGNGNPEVFFMDIDDNSSGANEFRYKIGWDVHGHRNEACPNDIVYMNDKSCSDFPTSCRGTAGTIGWETAGGGIDIGDIDSDGLPEMVFLGIEKTTNKPRLIIYNLDSTGHIESTWRPYMEIPLNVLDPIGGAGISIADIDNDGDLDIMIMGIEKTSSTDKFKFRFGINGAKNNSNNPFEGGYVPIPSSAPTTINPPNNSTSISLYPPYTWGTVSEASTYHLQVSTNSNFNSFIVNVDTIIQTNYSQPSNNLLNYYTKYYWRVCAKNTYGEGPWSTIWNFTTSQQGGTGCPYVSTWNGNEFVVDNNILPQSGAYGYPDTNVTDYYKIYTPIKLDNGKYQIELSEFERELTTMDQVKLIAVDHSGNTNVAILPNGEIVEYFIPYRLNRVDSNDVSTQLSSMDKNAYTTSEGEKLTLNYEASNMDDKLPENIQGGLLVGGNMLNEQISGPFCVPIKDPGPIDSEKRGTYQKESLFPFRERSSITYLPLQKIDGQISLKFTKKVVFDYAALAVKKTRTTYKYHELNLLVAQHSKMGNITNVLKTEDGTAEELYPGETIRLTYESVPLEPGYKRSFVLKSSGHYKRIGEGESLIRLPKVFTLQYNYPNPFNPVTIIKYELPKSGFVSLKVYDILGREIAMLVDEYKDAGYYTVEFNASRYSSGVYFYKLQAGNFVTTKKMLLAR